MILVKWCEVIKKLTRDGKGNVKLEWLLARLQTMNESCIVPLLKFKFVLIQVLDYSSDNNG